MLAGASAHASTVDTRVAYNVEVELGVLYEITWHDRSGSTTEPCRAWGETDGTNQVLVHNIVRKAGIPPLRGRFALDPGAPPAKWASLWAVGESSVEVERKLDVRSGHTACGSEPVRLDPPPALDCGRRKVSAAMTVLAARARAFDGTLTPPNDGPRVKRAFELTVQRPTVLYKACPSTEAAPEFPAGFPITVRPRDWDALRHLKFGHTYRTGLQEFHGACDSSIPTKECSFEVELRLTFKRTSRV